MRYIALHYVKIAGRTYTPGEIFEADIPPEKEERLLRLEAIRPLEEDEPVSPLPAKTETPKKPKTPKEPETPEEPQAAESVDDGEAEADEGEAEANDGYTETDEDAPEIDVMAGLVAPVADEAPKVEDKPKAAKGGRTKK